MQRSEQMRERHAVLTNSPAGDVRGASSRPQQVHGAPTAKVALLALLPTRSTGGSLRRAHRQVLRGRKMTRSRPNPGRALHAQRSRVSAEATDAREGLASPRDTRSTIYRSAEEHPFHQRPTDL